MDNEPIEVESSVTTLSTPDCPERDIAQELVNGVVEERKAWLSMWHAMLFDPSKATIEDFPLNTVGCSPGSCQLKIGERVIAKFVVRFREEPLGCEIDADWPSQDALEAQQSSLNPTELHEVQYECIAGRVDWRCDDLDLEGTAGSIEMMKRKLIAKYGFRFRFSAV